MSAEREAVERAIGCSFRDPSLLRRALTHKSCAYEKSAAGESPQAHNELLEFLGDSVLGLLVSELLFLRYPDLSEGRLSKLKAHYVSAVHLAEAARALDLGAHLLLGRGEELTGGRAKKALLADALEAVIGAIYLDAGLDAARTFVSKHVLGGLRSEPEAGDGPLTNFKSALQELAQARGLPLPRYLVVGETGPEHAKTFVVEVLLGPDWVMQAEARTKKAAGQKAAELLLTKLAASGGAGDPSDRGGASGP
ncbi:MAG: ribonuclease III [Bryobacterales bacterium]|nr:ribonuclease III [Bryobacterales bacterium]